MLGPFPSQNKYGIPSSRITTLINDLSFSRSCGGTQTFKEILSEARALMSCCKDSTSANKRLYSLLALVNSMRSPRDLCKRSAKTLGNKQRCLRLVQALVYITPGSRLKLETSEPLGGEPRGFSKTTSTKPSSVNTTLMREAFSSHREYSPTDTSHHSWAKQGREGKYDLNEQ